MKRLTRDGCVGNPDLLLPFDRHNKLARLRTFHLAAPFHSLHALHSTHPLHFPTLGFLHLWRS